MTRAFLHGCMATLAGLLLTVPSAAWAHGTDTLDRARDRGISGIWLLANLAYAGMRAQNHPSKLWRVVCLLAGLPGTLLTFLPVEEGGERAYGVDLPKRRAP